MRISRHIHMLIAGLITLGSFANDAFADGAPLGVPEIDPTSICSAVGLLIGGALLFASGKRGK